MDGVANHFLCSISLLLFLHEAEGFVQNFSFQRSSCSGAARVEVSRAVDNTNPIAAIEVPRYLRRKKMNWVEKKSCRFKRKQCFLGDDDDAMMTRGVEVEGKHEDGR